jgi:pectate lyase
MWRLWVVCVAIAAAQDDVESIRVLEAGLRRAEPALREQSRNGCASTWPGLTIRDGRVTAAAVIDEIVGFAKSAGTTGGLGGEFVVVTNAGDYDPAKGEPVIAGSLRAAIAKATQSKTPAWIVFKVGKIVVKATFRLPDNVTLDGSCSDVTFESPVNVGQVYVFGTKNVIVHRLTFHKTGYESTADEGDSESAIRLNGLFDRVAILHNQLSECGDGCIDITTSPRKPLPAAARVTVAYNRIEKHDKTMLFGTFTCGEKGLPACDSNYVKANRDLPPAFQLTLVGNLFVRTAQRHPRVFGHVMADVVNNIFALAPLPRADGSFSDGYAIFVSNAARALLERNAFVLLSKKWAPHRAVWTVTTPGASRMPEDAVGFIRLSHNIATAKVVMGENEPAMVGEPDYRGRMRVLPMEQMSAEQAVACIAARAGVYGGSVWDRRLCEITQP